MTYSIINKTKWGVCSICGGKEQEVVKVKKDLFCIQCRNSQKAEELLSKQKNRTAARNTSFKLRSHESNEDYNRTMSKGYAELNRWFKDRRKEMTGKCHHCNGLSCKHDDRYFKFSICHILPKAYFPSVATHPSNFIELCFWNKNCHGNMDNKMLDLIEMNCWDEIVTKFCIMYPSIAEKEKLRIPSVLLQYIEVEK